MSHTLDDEEQWREYHVTPRYLAGSSGVGDPGFEPVADWPHHYLDDDGPCQLLVTSPDRRIRIGWFGDDYLLWKIAAHEDPVCSPRWTATFNHTMPAEIVAGLTTTLAHDYADGNDRFLAAPSLYWTDGIQPLTDAGWTHAAAERDTVEITAPDSQAGVLIDRRLCDPDEETWTLWAGPPSWGTRAEATFTARTPAHLIAATAAAMADPAPVIRTRRQIHRDVAHLVRLTPLEPAERADTADTAVPTPLEVRRTAVTAALARAARGQHTDLRVRAGQGSIPGPAVVPSVHRARR
ncbi:MAG: DUF317 domain-containing protein [Streptomycetaceae bacterium]|nr:DUF317 domain-containing protein [Streptomycetaceae bacterium]